MKVTFLYHSSFFVELESHCLLFDYFRGEIPQVDKPLYVFASHSHEDHFSPAIFRLAQPGREVHFLLSSDISPRQTPPSLQEQITFVAPHSVYELGDLKVATLRSTDMGVAFLIQCEGKQIYHAGDLNCWEWDGAPRVQNDQMVQAYTSELELLRGKEIDLAFVPLDPRQERYYAQGMVHFLQVVQPKYVFPMHMWEDYSVIPRFCTNPSYQQYAPLIQNVSRPGQSFSL